MCKAAACSLLVQCSTYSLYLLHATPKYNKKCENQNSSSNLYVKYRNSLVQLLGHLLHLPMVDFYSSKENNELA